ncbi:MAG TPA: hypothetical protein VGQ86_01595 [Candidatus Limnocylindria bacterium]|nr:hypothetical protein [Candidatus Limnocylindria bacterium]
MRDAELEATLTELGERLAYPRPTRLADAVRARLREPRPRRLRGFGPLPAFATAALLILVIAATGIFSEAIADQILRLRGVQIYRAPAAPASPSATASQRFPGQRVTLDEARQRAPFLRVPTDPRLGAPDEVYLDTVTTGERVTLVYVSRTGIPQSREAGVSAVVVELRGRIDQTLFAKVAGPGTRIDDVTVNGGPGFWLEGSPHLFFYRDESGNVTSETLRLAGNTLLWEQSGLTLRLEAEISRDDALRIAASMR